MEIPNLLSIAFEVGVADRCVRPVHASRYPSPSLGRHLGSHVLELGERVDQQPGGLGWNILRYPRREIGGCAPKLRTRLEPVLLDQLPRRVEDHARALSPSVPRSRGDEIIAKSAPSALDGGELGRRRVAIRERVEHHRQRLAVEAELVPRRSRPRARHRGGDEDAPAVLARDGQRGVIEFSEGVENHGDALHVPVVVRPPRRRRERAHDGARERLPPALGHRRRGGRLHRGRLAQRVQRHRQTLRGEARGLLRRCER
mmetsp:Transcript_6674/g.29394  ORF Transcript_6674/g.29394 Transcript_6674/m.29394 type:complete len:258 (-) Transcript_6674:667-1440(-)